MTLWTSAAAARATGGRSTTGWAATGVSIDTRTLQPGDLFIALKAARDGHDFVAQALENGAAAALVSRIPDGLDDSAPLLIVKDVQTGLEALGRAARARTRAKVVAVTGSVGKTSTKEMLRAVLGGQGATHAAEASYNNHWGVPLTLARMPEDSRFAVIEIGMNHPGEIAPLAALARPHVAIVTTVAAAHLEAFDDIDAIAREKSAIFSGLEPGGTAVFNADLPTSMILRDAAARNAARTLSFGETDGCDFRATGITIHDQTTVVQASAHGAAMLYKVAAPGRHFAVNALAVIATAEALGLDRALAISDLGAWAPGAGRGLREVISLDMADTDQSFDLIDDSYNANPASMAGALEVLAAARVRNGLGRIGTGRRIAFLGDMKELGRDEAEMHAALARLEAMQKIDLVHAVGPLMRHLWQELPDAKRGLWRNTAAEMAEKAPRLVDAGDVVLAKGSLSTGLGRVVDVLRKLRQGPAQSDQEDS